ncbi:MAG: TlpA family protein disulfide reductase [Crocinitomicaceae bacterium]|nr:TlpA family protein disulfide reductase [Crocinitomicaceae bacterium]
MKQIFSIIALLVCQLSIGQAVYPALGDALIKGQVVDGKNQRIMLANQNLGGASNPLAIVQADSTGKFKITSPVPFQDYYFLRFENGQILNLVLFGADSITVYTDSRDVLNFSSIINSPHSVLMNEFLKNFYTFKNFEDSLKNVLRADPTKQAAADAVYQPKAERFYGYRNAFINTYVKSPALIVALSAVDQEKKLIKDKQAMDFLAAGNFAKEIALPGVDGQILKLSDQKGKVVLLDFWASWCAPCRRENPNVVAMYKKYNESGFDVFSVSLDKPTDAEKWKAAIAQDGLIWPNHVSDLKGWQCAAAIDYAVKSIPFTVLIDREGKIISTNVRGADLQNQLAKIFGF